MNQLNYLLLLSILIVACNPTKIVSIEKNLYDELELVKYFKYSNSEDIEKIKSVGIKQTLLANSMIELYDDKTSEPLTKRVYHIDGEYLSDFGGIESFIKDKLKPFCDATGFKLELTNHRIEFDTLLFSRTEQITINRRIYKIFQEDYVRYGEGWYIAPAMISKMLNEELKIQKLEERFYLINSENDLSGAFLTQSQYEFFKRNIKISYWQPQKTEDWIKLYNIKIKS